VEEQDKRKLRPRQPGSLQLNDPYDEQPAAGEKIIGPVEAAPHWQSFYRAVSDAIAAMRPNT
jgi:hypothetical protein